MIKKTELNRFLDVNMAPVMTRRVQFDLYSHAAAFIKDLLKEDWTFSNASIKEDWQQIDINYDSDYGNCDLQAERSNGVIVEFQYMGDNSN